MSAATPRAMRSERAARPSARVGTQSIGTSDISKLAHLCVPGAGYPKAMRRSERGLDPSLARTLFAEAPVCHLASVSPDGQPLLRALNVVALDDGDGFALAFHGAPDGEKLGCVGQPAVIACERVVAAIPSWFTSPERACPATTWYLSAHASGTVEAVEDPAEKAAILRALMDRFQPEGRHRPITAEDPMYAAVVRNLLVARVRPERVTAKASVGQDKPPEVRHAVLRRLWERGERGDVGAIATALAFSPDPWPEWLTAGDVRLHVDAGPVEALAALLKGAEWNAEVPEARLAAAIRGGAVVRATVGGEPVGVARAVGDGAKFAWLADVYVAPAWRGRGVGEALARLVLDHPSVRGCRVFLRTRIAEGFWARHGFRTFAVEEGRPWMRRG